MTVPELARLLEAEPATQVLDVREDSGARRRAGDPVPPLRAAAGRSTASGPSTRSARRRARDARRERARPPGLRRAPGRRRRRRRPRAGARGLVASRETCARPRRRTRCRGVRGRGDRARLVAPASAGADRRRQRPRERMDGKGADRLRPPDHEGRRGRPDLGLRERGRGVRPGDEPVAAARTAARPGRVLPGRLRGRLDREAADRPRRRRRRVRPGDEPLAEAAARAGGRTEARGVDGPRADRMGWRLLWRRLFRRRRVRPRCEPLAQLRARRSRAARTRWGHGTDASSSSSPAG